MDQLTLLLAATTCRLSDALKLIRQQEALIESLGAQGRTTAGAEALLAFFKEAAAVINDQRHYLEGQVMFPAGRSHSATGLNQPNNDWYQVFCFAGRVASMVLAALSALVGKSRRRT